MASLKHTSLPQATALACHEVLLGSVAELPPEWACQGFAQRPARTWALKQNNGGPCGVLASVQAHLLRQIRGKFSDLQFSDATSAQTSEALVHAIATIIWACRVGRSATVVSCKSMNLPPVREVGDYLISTQCTCLNEVTDAVKAAIGAFCRPNGPGVALLLYSAILTRGLAMIARDADFPTPLILPNGYCAQELVNLLLFGRATSNVFDGERLSGGDSGIRLRGVQRASPIGFLTLFERQGSLLRSANAEGEESLILVGRQLKNPTTPIFVIQSEAHYSVLWTSGPCFNLGVPAYGDESVVEESNGEELPAGGTFDVFHFDQMDERDDPVRLTLKRRCDGDSAHSIHAPPLEQVINTRWPDAVVDWNGNETLL